MASARTAPDVAEQPTDTQLSSPTASLPALTQPAARISNSMFSETSSTRSSGVDLGDPQQAPGALEQIRQLDAAPFRLFSTPVPVENDENEGQSDFLGELQSAFTGLEDNSSCLDGLANSLGVDENEDQLDSSGDLRSALASIAHVTATLDQDKAPKFKQD